MSSQPFEPLQPAMAAGGAETPAGRTGATVSPAVVWHDTGDEGGLALFHPGTGRYYELNASGAAIWRGLARGATESEVVARLQRDGDAGADVIAADVRDFVRRMLDLGLLVPGDGKTAAPK